MKKKTLPIYDGAIIANRVGAFVKCGEGFQVIRPGFDSQGAKKSTWTQVIHDSIPIYTHKVSGELSVAMVEFDRQWAIHIGNNLELMKLALDACKKEHRRKFKDGLAGVEPAPTMTQDGRATGSTRLA